MQNFVTPANRLEDFNSNQTFQVYPNPFENFINISFANSTNLSTPVSIIIYDVLGRKCFEENNRSMESGTIKIELPSALVAGLYMIEIAGDNFRIQKPLVKN